MKWFNFNQKLIYFSVITVSGPYYPTYWIISHLCNKVYEMVQFQPETDIFLCHNCYWSLLSNILDNKPSVQQSFWNGSISIRNWCICVFWSVNHENQWNSQSILLFTFKNYFSPSVAEIERKCVCLSLSQLCNCKIVS
jgi:hypothetical protein